MIANHQITYFTIDMYSKKKSVENSNLCIQYIIAEYSTNVVTTNINPEYNTFFLDPTETKYVNKKIKTQNMHGLIPSANHNAIPNSIGPAFFNEISF